MYWAMYQYNCYRELFSITFNKPWASTYSCGVSPRINPYTTYALTMTQTELHFEPKVYQVVGRDKELIIPMHDDKRIELMIKELKAIVKREEERQLGYNDLPYGSEEQLLEAIDLLEKAIEWPYEIEDSYGEPPITMAEMHSAAWKEHQEAHR